MGSKLRKLGQLSDLKSGLLRAIAGQVETKRYTTRPTVTSNILLLYNVQPPVNIIFTMGEVAIAWQLDNYRTTMDGSRSNVTRRRANAAAASASHNADNDDDAADDAAWSSVQNKDGKIQNNNTPSSVVVVRRRRRMRNGNHHHTTTTTITSRIKRIFGRLGELRVVDVTLFLAIAAKLSSMVVVVYNNYNDYYRRTTTPSSSLLSLDDYDTHYYEQYTQISISNIDDDNDDDTKKWSFPKWVKIWGKEHQKIPFHSPLLYRREDDDYSFAHDSHLDDDDDDDDDYDDGNSNNHHRHIHTTISNKPKKKKTEFKGMLHAKMTEKKERSTFTDKMNKLGYAVVDDVLYSAPNYRGATLKALASSDMYAMMMNEYSLMDYYTNNETHFYEPAFDFYGDDEGEFVQRHSYMDDTWYDPYYAFDDDVLRGTLGLGIEEDEDEDEDEDERNVCTRPSFARMYHPTCNDIHASVSGYQWLIGEEIYSRRWTTKKKKRKYHRRFISSIKKKIKLSKYLGSGYYRDAFLFQTPEDLSVVFKTMKTMYPSEDGVSQDDQVQLDQMGFDPNDKMTFLKYKEYMRTDAMVIELLSSSPRAIDMYSHCSLSSVIEFAPTDMEGYIFPTDGFSPKTFVRRGEEKDDDGLDNDDEHHEPINNHISAEEKLEIALEMAKCIADMHGFEDGVIVNVDVQLGQFFKGQDGKIKIVDYNRAEPLLYDRKKEEYCRWANGSPGEGTLRSPEEK